MAAVLASPQTTRPPSEPPLKRGMEQFQRGDLALAVSTLEDAILTLAVEPERNIRELTQAYLYRGAAFVGLGLRDSADGSFAAALHYADHLRITERELPAAVVNAFEAARTRKAKAVFVRPPQAPKKIGGLAIAAAGTGVAAGAAVLVATRSGGLPAGPAEIAFLSSSPPPGSTMATAPGGTLPLFLRITLFHPTGLDGDGELGVSLLSESGARCAGMSFTKVYAPAGVAIPLHLSSFRYAEAAEGGCPLPATTTRISVKLSRTQGAALHEQELPVTFRFVPR